MCLGYLSWRCDGISHGYVNGINVEIYGYILDNYSGHLVGISCWDIFWISQDICRYLFRTSFQDMSRRDILNLQRSLRTFHHIPSSPRISEYIPCELPDDQTSWYASGKHLIHI